MTSLDAASPPASRFSLDREEGAEEGIQRVLVERTRLGIPMVIHEEGVGGFASFAGLFVGADVGAARRRARDAAPPPRAAAARVAARRVGNCAHTVAQR